MTEFNTVINKHIPKLDMYTLPLTRAHGKNHPEVFRVHELYQSISAKVKDSGESAPDLDEEFDELRQVTSEYALPSDACETYEAVYAMLSEADAAYFA